MALVIQPCLFCILYHGVKRIFRPINNIKKYSVNNSSNLKQTLALPEDAIDEFTSQLMQRKVDKWCVKNISKSVHNIETSALGIECYRFESADNDSLNVRFQSAIEIGENNTIMALTRQCIKYRKCPSLLNLNYVLTLCSQNGDKDMIVEIRKLCEEINPKILAGNSEFKHYQAEAMWIRGSICEAVDLFQVVYDENAFLRRRVRLALKYLILETLSNASEAVLVKIVRFGEYLAKTYSDYFPLMCIWQTCFTSEWFADQDLSFELLRRNEGLAKSISTRIPYVVTAALNNHRIELVYRLLEIFLEYEQKSQYSCVLLYLFDYQIRRGDIRSCCEIIQWSLLHDIDLPPIHNDKFIKMLLAQKQEYPEIFEKKTIAADKTNQAPNFKF